MSLPAEGFDPFVLRRFNPPRHRPRRDAWTLRRIRDRPPLLSDEMDGPFLELFGELFSLFHRASSISVDAEALKSLISLSTFWGKVHSAVHALTIRKPSLPSGVRAPRTALPSMAMTSPSVNWVTERIHSRNDS